MLKLVRELPVVKDAVYFSLPTILKPCYTSHCSVDPLAPIYGEVTQIETESAPAASSFSVKVTNPIGISVITSPTHVVSTTDKGELVDITLKEQGPLDRHIVVLIKYNELHTPHTTMENGHEWANQLLCNPAVMLDFFPKFPSVQAACEFVFVVDQTEHILTVLRKL